MSEFAIVHEQRIDHPNCGQFYIINGNVDYLHEDGQVYGYAGDGGWFRFREKAQAVLDAYNAQKGEKDPVEFKGTVGGYSVMVECITQKCGHERAVAYLADDPYKTERRRSLTVRSCPDCTKKRIAEHDAKQKAEGKKVRQNNKKNKALSAGEKVNQPLIIEWVKVAQNLTDLASNLHAENRGLRRMLANVRKAANS